MLPHSHSLVSRSIMCSWPITDEVPDVDALAPCALCDEVFPFVNVLSCRRLKGGKLFTCFGICNLARRLLLSLIPKDMSITPSVA